MTRKGKTVDTAPEITYYEWKNPKTGEVLKVPDGLDPGFDYNVGIEKFKPNLDEYPGSLAKMMKDMGVA